MSSMSVDDAELFDLSTPLKNVRYPEHATSSEREIVDLILRGLTVEEIADVRSSAVRTVTTQLSEIYRKAGVGSSRELAAYLLGVDGPWV